MKQKSITIIISLISILVPLLVVPIIVSEKTNIVRYCVLLIGSSLLMVLLFCNLKSFKIDSKDIFVLIFLLFACISTCVSSDIHISIFGRGNRFEGLLAFISYICIYLASKKYFKHENYKEILNLLFYTFMLIGILGIVQKYIVYSKLYPILGRGTCATFGNRNFFGSFICMVLPISTMIYIFFKSKKALLLSLVLFFDLILTGTRSAWVAFALVLIFLIVKLIIEKKFEYFKRFGILAICFVLIFIYLFNGFKFKINKTNDSKPQNNKKEITVTETRIKQIDWEIKQYKKTGNINKLGSNRIEIWKMTLKLIFKKPIFGCGIDNLNNGLHMYCEEEINAFKERTREDVDKAHNEFLQIGATMGIPALICHLIFLCLILFPKLKVIFKDKVYFIIFIAISSYLAQAFFNISVIGVAPLFWILLGIIDNSEMIKIFQNSCKN